MSHFCDLLYQTFANYFFWKVSWKNVITLRFFLNIEKFNFLVCSFIKCETSMKNYIRLWYELKFDENLKETFENPFKFCDGNINKCVFLLWQGVYAYKCIDRLKKYNKSSSLKQENVDIKINQKNIFNSDQLAWNTFELKTDQTIKTYRCKVTLYY